MAKPSRRFSRTVNIHCTNLRDVSLAAVVRRSVCCDQKECRSIEQVLQALLVLSRRPERSEGSNEGFINE